MTARWFGGAWLALSAAAFWTAGHLHDGLIGRRRAAGLHPGDPVEAVPPLVAFTSVALGGFRGLAVDLLWSRASELQDQGRYFELVQLADWVTKLQPRFASIWAFHAWNLAYNVSVMVSDPAERWRWVRHGLRLLRDEGLRYNPGSALLHRELAWMFHHKLGMDMDQAHWHYKKAWAEEMTRVLGGGRPEPELDVLAAMPVSEEDLTRDPAVAALLSEVRAAGFEPWDRRFAAAALPAALRGRWEDTEEGRKLEAFRRARRLREEYRLDPRAMLDLERRLGARFDWRLPYAHAVYWASAGLPHARTRFEDISLRRQIFQSLISAFLRGRLAWDPARDLFVMSPDPDLLAAARGAFDEALARHAGDPTVEQAHRNFLVDAIMVCALRQRREMARELFEEYRRRYEPAAAADLEVFVARTWAGRAGDLDTPEAMAAVEAAFYQAAFWRLLGDEASADGHEAVGRLCWERYMAGRRDPDLRVRTGLPPVEEIRRRAEARAREDLDRRRGSGETPAGALLRSCIGRSVCLRESQWPLNHNPRRGQQGRRNGRQQS